MMEITDCRVNHIVNPIGYAMEHPCFSWIVHGTEESDAERLVIWKADKAVYDTGWKELDSRSMEADLNLEARTRYTWQIQIRTAAGREVTSETNFFETGRMQEPWTGKWIGVRDQEETRHPVLFRNFRLERKVKSARLYITGLGLYEPRLNGMRLSDEVLLPGCTAYDDCIQVHTFDVTDDLQENNRLEVLLGNGWYRGRFGFRKAAKVSWQMIAELAVTFEDGSTQLIVSDESWKVRRSNILFSGIYDGEQVDETLPEIPVEAAVLMPAPQGRTEDRRSLPVISHEEFHPVLLKTPKGEQVLDIGQNMAGIFRFHVHEEKGTRIRLQFAELLQDGNFYRENLRTAKAEYVFVTDGTDQIIEPHFTFYGYRYVKVEGVKDLRADDFTGIALYSDIPFIGSLQTGNAKVNQLISNALWGMKSNYIDVPTDCPQRDERMGWTGDAQVFSETAMYFADPYAFFSKYLHDMSLEQAKNHGAVPVVVPSFGMHGTSSVWGDAACIIPMNMYRFTGDPAILKEQYGSMLAWVEYIRRVDGEDHQWRREFHFGDWLALDGAKNPGSRKGATDDDFIADIYYMHSVLLTAEAASVLGRKEDEKKLKDWAEQLRKEILAEYYTANGRCAIETMTGMILSLREGLGSVEKEAAKLKELLVSNGGKLATGFVGTPLLCDTLSCFDMQEQAYDLLLNEEYPGWLYEVNLGATTIWERWNSLDSNGSVTDTSMNSMNHYSYGSVVEWIFRHAAGLDTLEPGFRKAKIAPETDARLDHLDLSYASASGKYEVHWRIRDRWHLELSVTIPYGCTAELYLPLSSEKKELSAGTYQYEYETEEPTERLITLKSTDAETKGNEKVRAYLEAIPKYMRNAFSMKNAAIREILTACGISEEKELKRIERELIDLQ